MTPPAGHAHRPSADTQKAMLDSPALFLRDVDPVRGRAIFTPMNEESYRDSAFLDNRIVRAAERDLVVDLEDFLNKYFLVKPYLVTKTPPPDRERLQSPADRKKLDGLYECILCGCCSSSCPSYWADPEYLGPSALLNVWRFIEDSRDEGAAERLDILDDKRGAWRCHTILNCIEACPKNLNPTKAIAGIKKALVGRRF